MARDHDRPVANVRLAAAQEPIARVLERTGMRRLVRHRRDPRRRDRRAPGSLTHVHDAELLERELRVAQRIQRTLVLLVGVEAEGWEIASDYRPARSIGGDFFDVFPLLDPARPRHLGVVIADVSGKGIAAALLMAFVGRSCAPRSIGPATRSPRWSGRTSILVNERRTGLFVTVLVRRARARHRRLHLRQRRPRDAAAGPADGAEPRWVEAAGRWSASSAGSESPPAEARDPAR